MNPPQLTARNAPGPAAEAVEQAGDDLLPGAGLAGDHHRARMGGHGLDAAPDGLDGRARPGQLGLAGDALLALRGSAASGRVQEHGVAEAEHVPLRQRVRVVHGGTVEASASGGAEVVHHGPRALEENLRVPERHGRIVEGLVEHPLAAPEQEAAAGNGAALRERATGGGEGKQERPWRIR